MATDPKSLNLKADEIPLATSGLNSPTIYVDVIRGAAVMGEVSKLSLIEHRIDALEDTLKAIHVGTLVLPTSQLRSWGVFFTKLADQIGIPVEAEPAGDGQ